MAQPAPDYGGLPCGQMPQTFTRHSYRDDPNVESFDDQFPIALMDGHCALCSAGARMIDRLDRSQRVRICTVQSSLGSALMAHYGMRADDPESWLLLDDGVAYHELDAVVRLGRHCGLPGRSLVVLLALPKSWRSRLYRWVARNRYRWFGRADLCAMPAPGLRARLIGITDQ